MLVYLLLHVFALLDVVHRVSSQLVEFSPRIARNSGCVPSASCLTAGGH